MAREEQDILNGLSDEDKMLLALLILDLRNSGPQHLEKIQASHSASGGQRMLEKLLAAFQITLPRALARIFTWTEFVKVGREKRRIKRLLDIGVRGNLLRSDGQYSSTPAAERWAEETYAAAGSETYNNDMSIITLAVQACEALDKHNKLHADDLRRECAPRVHPMLLQDAAHQRMHQGQLDSYQRAFDLALLHAEREGWIRNDESGECVLTERGRDVGLHYFDHVR